jgi:hypothetical protein
VLNKHALTFLQVHLTAHGIRHSRGGDPIQPPFSGAGLPGSAGAVMWTFPSLSMVRVWVARWPLRSLVTVVFVVPPPLLPTLELAL